MTEQFFYYEERTKGICSFSMNMIDRTVGSKSGNVSVVLKDFRAALQDFEVPKKNGAKSIESHIVDVCSEIHLNKIDSERFLKVAGCDIKVEDYIVEEPVDTPTIQHEVTQEDLDNNPELVEVGVQVGERIELDTMASTAAKGSGTTSTITEEQALAGMEATTGL